MITQERLQEALSYNPETGEFIRKLDRPNVRAGTVAGGLSSQGYITIYVMSKQYYAHRLAWLYMYGKFPEGQIDHINGIRTDNRISNLRSVSHEINGRNAKKPATNTSGVIGVFWAGHAKKWRAGIMVRDKTIHLGYYADIEDAAKARKEAEAKYGFHPNHGRS